jgi:BASS family bile acid:Na+ symporter
MLGMGLTLVPDDFKRVGRMPRPVALGFAAQYTIMPALGWGIAHALRLDPPFAVGLVLVACCPGGTASNIVTYLARADVALSVVMTMCSTFAAVFMTPLLTSLLAGTWVRVDATGLFLNTAQVVLLPLLLGLALRRAAPRAVERVLPAAPLVSVIGVALIVGSIVGANAPAIRAGAASLLLAVFLLHAGGFGLGWLAARICRQTAATCRTVSIEVGMQNSGLGVVLARSNFADPLTAVPCAISSVFHSLIGSLLAGWWRLRDGARRD